MEPIQRRRSGRRRQLPAIAAFCYCCLATPSNPLLVMLSSSPVKTAAFVTVPQTRTAVLLARGVRNKSSSSSSSHYYEKRLGNTKRSTTRGRRPSTKVFFDPHSLDSGPLSNMNSTDYGALSPTTTASSSDLPSSSTELSALAASFSLDPYCDDTFFASHYTTTATEPNQATINARSKLWSSNSGTTKPKIYCDLDGCLVNFERGVRTLFRRPSHDFERVDRHKMWEGIQSQPQWFERLDWQMDGRRLWSAIRHLEPDILTGVPFLVKSSRVEKFNWCKRELGLHEAHHVDMAAEAEPEACPVVEEEPQVDCNEINNDWHLSVNGNLPREDKTNVITCWSSNKHKECHQRGSILIDDRIDLGRAWEDAGGIFVHHVNSETTIRKLRQLGVLSEDPLECSDREGWYWEGDAAEGHCRLWSGSGGSSHNSGDGNGNRENLGP